MARFRNQKAMLRQRLHVDVHWLRTFRLSYARIHSGNILESQISRIFVYNTIPGRPKKLPTEIDRAIIGGNLVVEGAKHASKTLLLA